MRAPTNADAMMVPVGVDKMTETPGQGWTRLPGLFRRWEFESVVEQREDYFFENAGMCDGGMPLFAIYHCDQAGEANS